MDEQQKVEQGATAQGLTVQSWGQDDDGIFALLGRFVVDEDVDEEMGPFAGDEGELTASIVGSPAYGNERVAFFLRCEGMDPQEVDPSLLSDA